MSALLAAVMSLEGASDVGSWRTDLRSTQEIEREASVSAALT